MKQVFLFILTILLFSCTHIEEYRYIPPQKEALLQEVEGLLNKGEPSQALTILDRFQRDFPDYQAEETAAIRERINGTLGSSFEESIVQEDWEIGLQILYSLTALNLSPEKWTAEDIVERNALKLLISGENTLAIRALLQVMRSGTPEEATLQSFAEFALEHNEISFGGILLPCLEENEVKPPEGFKEMVGQQLRIDKMVPATVTIWVNRGIKLEGGVGFPDRVIGSGFFIDRRGYILTNYHVIESEVDPQYEGYSRLFIRLSKDPDQKIPAKVVGWDKNFDIALLKTEIDPEISFSFFMEEDFYPGERIFAIGSPGGLENTVTAGIVSATGRRLLQLGDTLQVDVPINFGNSGGPLLNEEGDLVAVVFAGIEQFEGINFAIPGHWIMDLLPRLYQGGAVIHSWMGASVMENLLGLEVVYTVPDSPVQKAGILLGDIITGINGVTYTRITDVQKKLLQFDPGVILKVEWMHGDDTVTGFLALEERPPIPMEIALEKDSRDNVIPSLFGMKIEKTGTRLFKEEYVIKDVYRGSIADETGLSVNDPLTIIGWEIDWDQGIIYLKVKIKKRSAGFLESAIQLGAYLETANII